MNIETLIEYTQKPEIYTESTAEMWTDDHISKHLLETHLNPEIDLASRKKNTIADTVEWILKQSSGNQLTVLDLGCGPGLYAQLFCEKGHDVTGMDFSKRSIDYAQKTAWEKNLDIHYIHQDYLTLRDQSKYDLAYMIFTDFGVLNPVNRGLLLGNIYNALKPGGIFIFDVLNEKHLEKAGKPETAEKKDWQISKSGFWRDMPHLVLYNFFLYENEKVILNQHVVVEDSGKADVYRFWNHGFSHKELKQITENKGFQKTICCDGVLPDSDMVDSEDVTFCITRKPM